MTLIDSHQHVFWHNHDDAWLVDEMDRLGIDVAWLLTCQQPPGEDLLHHHAACNPMHMRPDGTHAGMPLSDVVMACRRYPDRFVAGFCPVPTHPLAPRLFEAAYHMHGVRVCGEWYCRMLLDDPRAIAVFQKAGDLGCPVVIDLVVPHLPGKDGRPQYQTHWTGGTVANLARAMDACKETVFIGHGPGFWREISGDSDGEPSDAPTSPIVPGGRLFSLFEQYPTLCADLSAGSGLRALQRQGKGARDFVIRFADRLLFGRDAYGDNLYQFLKSLKLPEDVQDAVYFGNARKLVPECAK